jgi:hypothetical protein
MNLENKICQNCKKEFVIESDDFNFYEKIKVPPPTWCPECRKQRRLSWRNDFNLYTSKCKLCGKSVVTLFSPESKMNVYCNKCWWSDNWDPRDYAVDYDFSKPFFIQIKELIQKVPVLATVNDDGIGSINSEYTHDFSFSKNCYMVFVAWKIENTFYTYYAIAGKDIIDCTNIMDFCELIYEGIQLEKCSRVKWAQNCISCLNSAFLYDCRDCNDCFMCAGLRHKKYHFLNKPYSKEEYQKIIDSYHLHTWSGSERAKKEFAEFIIDIPRKFSNNKQCHKCTGDFLINGKNSQHCFNVQKPENDKWIENADSPKDSYDLSVGGELSECYEGITVDHSNKNLFGIFSWKNHDIEYTHHCHNSHDLFGCVALKNAEYCILNKQYSKEEYEKLRNQIISDMNNNPYIDARGMQYKFGEFYPAELSYFGYNETLAQGQFPLEKEEILKNNWKWQDSLQRTTGKETIQPGDISESIKDVKDNITEEVLRCVDCNRNYKIIKLELDLYRRMEVPIPRKCFYCRLSDRFKKQNPYKLWHRKCMKPGCTNEFETSYSPERPEIIYCESCYNQEVA